MADDDYFSRKHQAYADAETAKKIADREREQQASERKRAKQRVFMEGAVAFFKSKDAILQSRGFRLNNSGVIDSATGLLERATYKIVPQDPHNLLNGSFYTIVPYPDFFIFKTAQAPEIGRNQRNAQAIDLGARDVEEFTPEMWEKLYKGMVDEFFAGKPG